MVRGQEIVGVGPAGAVMVSATARFFRVTFPVFVTTKEYVTLWPAAVMVAGLADLVTVTAGDWVTATVAGAEVADAVPPPESVPDTDAVLTIDPLSTSAWVAAYVAVHVVDAPTASVVVGQVTTGAGPAGADGMSVTEIDVSGALPVFVTTKE